VHVSSFWIYFTLFGFGRVLLYLSQFSTVFYHWRLIYNVFQCSLKGPKRQGVRVSTFWSYSTLFGFGGEVMLYFSQFSTIFYHWRLVYNVFQCSVKGPKRQEVRVSTFWSYSTLFGFGGEVMLYLGQFSTVFYRWRLVYNVFRCSLKGLKRWEVRVSTFQSYSTLFGFGRVMLYLSQFSTIRYHWRLVWRTWRYLVLGGLCCISVISPLFLSLKARLQCIIVLFEGPEEVRGVCVCISEIFHIIWFLGVTLSWAYS